MQTLATEEARKENTKSAQRREFSCLETFNVIAQARSLFVFFCYESQSISSPQNPGPNRFSGLQSILSF